MIKNYLATLGLIFIALLGILGLFLLYSFWDLTTPTGARVVANGTPASVQPGGPKEAQDLGAVETLLSGNPKIEWSNPLDSQPFPTLAPDPTATPTPVPPLDPAVYRTEVMLRLKEYAAALQAFIAANEKLSQDSTLLDDPDWTSQIDAALDRIDSTGQALAAIDPAPQEYQTIDALLKRVGPETQGLVSSYRMGMQTREAQSFTEAGDHFDRIKEYLSQTVAEITRLGWPVD